jgi:hypothetical protein
MIQREVVNKIAMEMAHRLGDFEHLKTCKFYINMAITIGTEYFTRQMEEIVAMKCDGIEVGRFRSIVEASDNLGICQQNIRDVINGRHHTAGGLIFMKTKDKELIKREELPC